MQDNKTSVTPPQAGAPRNCHCGAVPFIDNVLGGFRCGASTYDCREFHMPADVISAGAAQGVAVPGSPAGTRAYPCHVTARTESAAIASWNSTFAAIPPVAAKQEKEGAV